MKLETLYEFVIVAKYLNITKAAQELYISQPSLSGHMTALERELGYSLFNRSRNCLALTAAGTIMLDYAQRIMALYQEALTHSAKAAKHVPSIKIAALPASSPHLPLLPPYDVLPYSFVDLDIKTPAIDALVKGTIDIAIESDYSIVDELKRESDEIGVSYFPIGEDRCFIAVMAHNPLASRQAIGREDLNGQTIIINSGSHFDRWSKMVQTLLGSSVQVEFRLNSMDSLSNLAFVDFGLSVYICGDEGSRTLLSRRDDVVVFDELDGRDLTLPVALLCRTEDRESKTSPTHRFIEEFLRRLEIDASTGVGNHT